MRIRATIPFSCHVTGPTADALSPAFEFRSRGCQVSASFLGDNAIELAQPIEGPPWFRKVRALVVEIEEGEADMVTRAVTTNEAGPILAFVLKPANRVIRAIRNFGLVTHVREYRAEEFGADYWLDLLGVETSVDGVTWTRLREPPDDLVELLARQSMLRREHIGQFNATDLADIREAIEDNLRAGPERVFLANALEYLRTGELRVAVVESVICLEMLLGDLLPQLLTARGITRDALPELTLSFRVKLLMPLLLSTDDLADVDLAVVAQTITWRNKVAHEGNLPQGTPEEAVRRGISAVVHLSHRLARKRDAMKREPGLRTLAQKIRADFQVREPTIQWGVRHMFTVTFPFFFDQPPPMPRLAEIAQAVVDGLAELDTRCQPPSDVFIFFTLFGKEIATWQRGQFIVIPGPLPTFPI